MPAPAYTTYLEAVNLSLQSVGHPTTTDVASSTDEAVLRMGFYVNQACMELLFKNYWDHLIKKGTISVISDAPGQAEKGFDLPSDYAAFVDDTQWNTSTQLPALGPVSPQDWQWLVVRTASVTTRFMWRVRGGQLWIKSPPDTAQDLIFEYLSKLWGTDEDGVTRIERMSKNGDYHSYPWNLVVLLARLKWLKNEGFDTDAAEKDFNAALEFYTGADGGATVLSLVPNAELPYINAVRNLPPSGYGS